MTFSHWYINTDGAPSHFKNKYTMQSLFEFKTKSGASTILWETCAPGHGKGPWDGVGAVIKRLLRELERLEKVRLHTPKDAFDVLVAHAEEWSRQIGSKALLDKFVYHYIPSGDETVSEHRTVYPAIRRPPTRPTVTALPGIRSHFCFRVAESNALAYRELSCRCNSCLSFKWSECKNRAVGSWKHVLMSCKSHTGARTRSQRSAISSQRRKLACSARVDSVLALQSSDDSEGFVFWLALATGPAFKHKGQSEEIDGVKRGGYYITVRIYERFPPSSHSSFKLAQSTWTVDAEGVINVRVCQARRSTRSAARGTRSCSVRF